MTKQIEDLAGEAKVIEDTGAVEAVTKPTIEEPESHTEDLPEIHQEKEVKIDEKPEVVEETISKTEVKKEETSLVTKLEAIKNKEEEKDERYLINIDITSRKSKEIYMDVEEEDGKKSETEEKQTITKESLSKQIEEVKKEENQTVTKDVTVASTCTDLAMAVLSSTQLKSDATEKQRGQEPQHLSEQKTSCRFSQHF